MKIALFLVLFITLCQCALRSREVPYKYVPFKPIKVGLGPNPQYRSNYNKKLNINDGPQPDFYSIGKVNYYPNGIAGYRTPARLQKVKKVLARSFLRKLLSV